MADLTLEIIRNKEKYPDDRKIVLGDGEEITCRELREQLQPRSEWTQEHEKWQRRERELQGDVERHREAVDGLNQQLAAAMQQAPPAARTPSGGISEEDLLADAVLGPLFKEQKRSQERLEAHEQRLAAHEKYVLEREYRGQLGTLASRHNTRFNADGKGTAFNQAKFLDFCLQRQISDLDVAYDAWSRPEELAQTTREAEARGEERGKAIARVPAIPFGRRRAPTKPEGLPASFQDVTDEMIADDPEIREAMEKDATG